MLEEYQRVLVTGGCGFIGSHLVSALISLDKEVIVLDNLSSGSDDNLVQGVRLTRGDVRDPGDLIAAVHGVDLVFHVAANANGTRSVNDPRFDFETNTRGTFNVLEAAVEGKIRRMVFVSSAAVYGIPQQFPMREDHPTEPFIPYGASKLATEVLCKTFFHAYGLPVVIGRPFPVYGSRENPDLAMVEVSRFLRWHLNGKPIQVVGDPDRKTRDFVHVSDAVQCLLLLADQGAPGEAYNIGSGEEVSMQQLAETIGAATGRPATVEAIRHITEDTYRLVADITKIKALGYTPRMALSDGVRQVAQELGDLPALPAGETIFKRGQQAEVSA